MTPNPPPTQSAPNSSGPFAASAVVQAAAVLLLSLLPMGRAAFGQALPTAERSAIPTGFSLPHAEGSLNFAVSASESLTSGYYAGSGIAAATNLNADVAYISPSKRRPFSLVFSGGRSWSGSGYASPIYLNLAVSQVLPVGHWNFVLSDSVGYLPATPSTGLSGVPGVGDLGVPPVVVGSDSGLGILTTYSTRVANTASIGAQRPITGKTSLNLTGSYTMLRFVGDSDGGYNSDGYSGSGGLSHMIDPRNSISGNYSYSRYTYGVGEPNINSQTVSGSYSRKVTRRLNVDVSAGPQWTSYSNTPQPLGTSINLFASVAAGYTTEYFNMALTYARGVNSGSGVVFGARSDSIRYSLSRTFDQVWNTSFSAGYTRSTSLGVPGTAPFAPQTVVASLQVSRAFSHGLSAFASYTLLDQTTPGSGASTNVFSGLAKVAAFGLTFSPPSLRLGSN